MLLKPEKTATSVSLNRLFTLTSRQMPDARKHDMRGAVVTVVSADMDDIIIYLGGSKCWQGLDVAPARPCGEGIYEIIRHGFSGPLHFIYELELPLVIGNMPHYTYYFGTLVSFNMIAGDAQRAFHISKSASYTVSAKNPDAIDPHKRPLYTPAQMDHFRGQKVEWKKWGIISDMT